MMNPYMRKSALVGLVALAVAGCQASPTRSQYHNDHNEQRRRAGCFHDCDDHVV